MGLSRIAVARGLTVMSMSLTTLTFPSPVAGFDVSWRPTASQSVRFLERAVGGLGFDAEPGIEFQSRFAPGISARDANWLANVQPWVNVRRFALVDDIDANEHGVDYFGDWQGERFSTGITGAYVQDTTLINEATDVGGASQVRPRRTLFVAPRLQVTLTDTLFAQANFSYTDVTFDAPENTSLIDFRSTQFSQGLNWQWRESLQLFGTAFVSRFEPEGLGSTSTNLGGQGGVIAEPWESVQVTASAGYIFSRTKSPVQSLQLVFVPFPAFVIVTDTEESESAGPLANVRIVKSFQQSSMDFEYTRQVSPGGRGTQTIAELIEGNYSYRLNEVATVGATAFYEKRVADGEILIENVNRDQVDFVAFYRYAIDERWSLYTSYRFTRFIDALAGGQTTNANEISLVVTYDGLERTLFNGL